MNNYGVRLVPHFFSGVFTPVPIRFLRQHDRKLLAKPWRAERASPFPTRVQPKFCTNIAQPNVARGNCGFHRSLEPGHQRYAYQCKLKAPLKKRETLRFPPQFRTGQQNRLPHSRYARQLWFRRYPRHRATRDKCIRRCAKAPLKIL